MFASFSRSTLWLHGRRERETFHRESEGAVKAFNFILLFSLAIFEGVVVCMVGVVACSQTKRTLAIHARMVETGEDLQEPFRESLMDVSSYFLMSSLATLFMVLTFGAMYVWHESFRRRLRSDPFNLAFLALVLLLGPCIGLGNFAGIYGALWYQPSSEDLMQFRPWIIGIGIGSQMLLAGSSLWRIHVVKQRESAAAQLEG